MDDKDEKKLMWDRLTYVPPPKPNLSIEQLRMAWIQTARRMGKSTMAMQALGRALRKENENKTP